MHVLTVGADFTKKSPDTFAWGLGPERPQTLFVGGAFADRGLSSGEAGYWDTERGAAHVVEADVVAELDGFWFSAVLAADAEFDVWSNSLGLFDGDLHELANAALVDAVEWIAGQDLLLDVWLEELVRVVSAEAEGHLGQVVRSKAEELGFHRDLVGGEGTAWDFDHRAEAVRNLDALLFDNRLGGSFESGLDDSQFVHVSDKRNHDFWNGLSAGLDDRRRAFQDGSGLHFYDLWVDDRESHTAKSEHWVDLVHRFGRLQDSLLIAKQLALGAKGSYFSYQVREVRKEFVKRWVDESDRRRKSVEHFKDFLEVLSLELEQLAEGNLSRFGVVDVEDHVHDDRSSIFIEEHVLGSGETDAFCTEVDGLLNVGRSVGVGSNLEGSELVGPAHEGAEVAGHLRVFNRDLTFDNLTEATVERDEVAFFDHATGVGELSVLGVNLDFATTSNGWDSKATSNEGRVAGHATALGENALSGEHSSEVVWRRVSANEDDSLALTALSELGCAGRIEDSNTRCSTRTGRETLGDDVVLGARSDDRKKNLVKKVWSHSGDGFLLVDSAFVDHLDRDSYRSGSGSLSRSALQNVQLVSLDRELDVLHILVVIFEDLAGLYEFGIDFWVDLVELADRERRSNTCNHVFALGVDEVFAEDDVFAGRGVSGEGNAGSAVVAHVSEDHGLNVDGSSDGIVNLFFASINDGSVVVPASEDGFDGFLKLFAAVLWEVASRVSKEVSIVVFAELLEVVAAYLKVVGHAELRLQIVEELLESVLADVVISLGEGHVGKHHDEASIAVVNESLICASSDHCGCDFVVQTEVQNGVHHAGHGEFRTGSDGEEKWVGWVAELLVLSSFDVRKRGFHFREQRFWKGFSGCVVFGADFGGDGESWRDRKTDVGHLGKVCSLASKEITLASVALAE